MVIVKNMKKGSRNVYRLLKDSFNDIFTCFLQARLAVSMGYEKVDTAIFIYV